MRGVDLKKEAEKIVNLEEKVEKIRCEKHYEIQECSRKWDKIQKQLKGKIDKIIV